MKKLFLLTVLFVIIFSAISYARIDKIYEAAVVGFKGDVKVDMNANGTWAAPFIGMKLMKEAVIKTGPDSQVDIVFDADGLNVVSIKGNTQITVRDADVFLKSGSVLAKFANLTPGSSFTVTTPTAVCGMRGSGMGVDHINGMTVVMAFEHSVFVQGLDAQGNPVDKEVVIPEGWKMQVQQEGNTTPPETLSENEKKIFEAWVEVVTTEEQKLEEEKTEEEKSEADLVQTELTDTADNKDLQDKKDANKEISPSQSSSDSSSLTD